LDLVHHHHHHHHRHHNHSSIPPPSHVKGYVPDDRSRTNFQNLAVLINLTMDKSKIMLLTKTETVNKDIVHHGCPAYSLPSCIMQPVATCCSTIELHNNFGQLCVPLCVIFTCAAHKLAQQ